LPSALVVWSPASAGPISFTPPGSDRFAE